MGRPAFHREDIDMTGIGASRSAVLSASVAAILLVFLLVAAGCKRAEPPSTQEPGAPARQENSQGAPLPKSAADATATAGPPAPEVEVQTEDYALARSRFRTKLVRETAAPQPWSPVNPPAGISEVEIPSGKLRLRAWLNRPTDVSRKYSAVLFLHGGFAFDREDWDISQPYRDAGFIVLTPMLRGENGQAGWFTLWYDEVDDVLAAAMYLSEQPYVDTKRLYVAGSSAGGTLALLAAEASKRFCAAASFSASPDQVVLAKYAKIDLPFDKNDPRELQMRSPLAYAPSFKCPVRIYYATQDHFIRTSEQTAAVAKERALDVEAVRMEGDHGSIVPAAIKQSIEFFQKH
jgi:dipeptidyl aminopeptidase/acylaminoacyl peptidase